MFLWFVVLAPVIVAEVFRSPMIDYRMVVLGAIAPLTEAFTGGPNLLHTLLGAVGLLGVVMAATPGRRLLRRRLLGMPIGLLLHLVLDGTWASKELLWWPAFGTSFGAGQIPEFTHGVAGVALEVVAILVLVWAVPRFGLDEAENRSRLWSTGQLNRQVLS